MILDDSDFFIYVFFKSHVNLWESFAENLNLGKRVRPACLISKMLNDFVERCHPMEGRGCYAPYRLNEGIIEVQSLETFLISTFTSRGRWYVLQVSKLKMNRLLL